ncbi:MAG: CapA family protein [Bryobacterales bacterium]|nr:CapA family protein [Bryobacterales bacterium]
MANVRPITLFLCGDVMTGRGIDQVLPHPSNPVLYEGYMKSALGYVAEAEQANGPIPRRVGFPYIWGDALAEFDRLRPDLRIINLETSITTSGAAEPKGINYRMHPANAACLSAAGIDCATLANNHVLDWGRAGLIETCATLERLHIRTAGAGRDLAAATAPAVFERKDGRVLVFAAGTPASGVPEAWAAAGDRPGIVFLPDLSSRAAAPLAAAIHERKRPGDTVVLSIHWGPNWGYAIPPDHRSFAHRMVEEGVDVVYGHSSHHPIGIEVFRNKLILYGCGDFLNDYEGIGGYEEYRPELCLMYFVALQPAAGDLLKLEMKPLEIRNFRLRHASLKSAQWLCNTLDREGQKLGIRVHLKPDHTLYLEWQPQAR